ncbi:unnamed protein product [Linum tenue]|uniref:Uncharacterized protein n=1 Tax=Linum tenue TaxID=586396 RepID=A0AAV0QYV0_9ROSI|nr:unnamed protein product [Linum tenue]CAI0550181.1 unnamed protein product [Linum tenue]
MKKSQLRSRSSP